MVAAADTYVRDGSSASINFGSGSLLVVKDGGEGYEREALVRFDLTGQTSVETAVLKLFVEDTPDNTGDPMLGAFQVTDDTWDETTVDWTTRPTLGALIGETW